MLKLEADFIQKYKNRKDPVNTYAHKSTFSSSSHENSRGDEEPELNFPELFPQDVQEEVPEHTSQRHGGMRSGVDKILSPFLVGRNNS